MSVIKLSFLPYLLALLVTIKNCSRERPLSRNLNKTGVKTVTLPAEARPDSTLRAVTGRCSSVWLLRLTTGRSFFILIILFRTLASHTLANPGSGGNAHHLSHLLAALAAHAHRGSPSFPISQCRRTRRGSELMGRLLFLIFTKVTTAPLLARYPAPVPGSIRRAARLRATRFAVWFDADRSVCAWKASPPLLLRSPSLQTQRAFCTAVS